MTPVDPVPDGPEREARRQQWLLQTLLDRDPGARLLAVADPRSEAPRLGQPAARLQRGLHAYVANAGASAERALGGSFPTLVALLGDEPFAGLARAYWRAAPPQRGDLAAWGAGLAAFVADSETLSGWPYLADCACLDWLIAQAERALDDDPDPTSWTLLGEADPDDLAIDLAPGAAVLASPHPVVALWEAHRTPGAGFEAARTALAEGRAEQALVWRDGWRARVAAVDAATAHWTQALLRGDSLGQALETAGASFDFEHWLVQALQKGWACRVRRRP